MTQSTAPAAPVAPAEPSPSAVPSVRSAPAPVPAQEAAGGPYDVIVIGSGPGGYIAAIRAAQLKLKTACIERQFVGGICVNVGCIPSKALLHNAQVVRYVKDAKTFGIQVGDVQVDYGAAVDRSRQVVDVTVKGIEYLFRKNKVELIRGEAKITARDTVSVGGRDLKTKNIIIATGSRPREFPNMPVDGERIVNSWQMIVDRERPEHVAVVGGGVIGVEMGTVFRSYGSQVTILEMLPHLLPREDEKVSVALERSFQKQGFKLQLGVTVESVTREGDKVRITYSKDGQQQSLEADRCLVAPGVMPNSENLGLQQAGVEVDRGYVKVDGTMRTNVPGIYAIGDVAATPFALAHVASAEGVQAANAIAGLETRPLKYNDMPRPVFCHPQVASIGLSEAEAKKAGYEVKVGQFPFSASGKARAENDTEGFVRIVADAKYGEILGAQAIGPEATEILAQVTPYKVLEGTTRELGEVVVSHPTLSEVVKEAALVVEGEALNI
jgi:dihydrolipoamide dehydrogenase